MDLPGGMDMGLHFTTSQIVASLVFGIIGLFVFRHGKKTLNYSVLFTGVAMMIYPMFTSGWLEDWGFGLGLCAMAYYFNKNNNLTG